MPKSVEALAQQLLQAQTQFVVAQLKSDARSELVAAEVGHWLDGLATVRLNEIVDKPMLLTAVRVCCVEYRQSKEILAFRQTALKQLLETVCSAECHRDTCVGEVLSKKEYDLCIEKMIDLKRLREDLIEQVLQSEIYRNLVSDVLYTGIKGFILEENLIAKLPGISTLLRMSKWGVSRTLPNLEPFVESAAKAFIAANIPATVALSQRTLEASLTAGNIRALADSIWEQLHTKKLAAGASYFNAEDFSDTASIVQNLWESYSVTPHFMRLVEELLDQCLETYGEQTIAALFFELGGNKTLLADQIERFLQVWVQSLDKKGQLETLVKRQLKPFYESEACHAILGQD